MKNVLKALGLLLVLLILCTLGFVQSSGTDYSFTLQSDAVSAPVNIVFDDMAVPHIYADSENDAMYALGYVHAAERLWQMDLLRRAGGGELSALLGPDMIENDQYLRTLGMNEAAKGVAEDFLTRAPVRIQSAMAAYLKGINRFIAEGDTPLEYRLLGTEPEPFDTHDVYCATGFMAYSFAIHLKTEPILDWMKQNLGPAYMADLALGPDGFTRIPVFGTPPDTLITPQTPDETVHMSAPVQRQDLTSMASTAHRLDALRPVPQWLGSNAWVIGGDKTASGKVIFCNDAHMGYAQPSVWYEAHIVTPEVEYYGNHLAGLPFPAIGHTRHHSWGITMFVNDDIDLYQETIEGDQYLFGNEWRDLETRTETIEVSGGEAVTFELRSTHHGPLIEDDVAMWWTFTQYPENRLHEAFFGFSRAESMEEVAQSASIMHAPGINLMYGDDQDNIAWWASAKLPIRPAHVDTKTVIDGADPQNDPQGWYPFSLNPQSVNPSCGYVYSANNAPDSVAGVHYPGHYYAGNTRGAGIIEAMEAKNNWTLEQAQALQLDHHSPVYRDNAARMVALMNPEDLDPQTASVLSAFKAWDGSHLGEDTAPTLYYRWMYRTIQGAMEDEFKRASDSTDVNPFESWHKTIVSENSFPRLLANLDAPWWDDVSTDVTETAQDIVGLALTRATADLTAELGNDPHHWHYNKLHTVTHKHAMSDVPVLGDWLNVGPFGLGAAKDALCKYEFKLKEAVDYSVFSGPSMRIGIDFNDIDAAESILPTGQSGNPFSDFYDNQAPLYHTGQFRKMRMNPSDIAAHATSTATIAP